MFLESDYKNDDSRPTVLILKNGHVKYAPLNRI